ncbi:MAG: double zinc ribbon domain-containing protein [Mariprofundaceae bacterium]
MKGLSTQFNRLVNSSKRLLFPRCCLFCHAAMNNDGGCCNDCLSSIEVLSSAACRRCGAPLPPDLAPGPCGRCAKTPPFQQQTASLFAYRGAVRDAILAWKLQGEDVAVRWLLQAASGRLKEIFRPEDVLLPIPMPLSRMRTSGLHHAAALCKMIAAISDCSWEWRLLRRVGEQPRQSSLSGVARRNNVRKAFHVDLKRWQSMTAQGRIWVVDDILTTGSTLHFAARALKPLNTDIGAFSLARTLSDR